MILEELKTEGMIFSINYSKNQAYRVNNLCKVVSAEKTGKGTVPREASWSVARRGFAAVPTQAGAHAQEVLSRGLHYDECDACYRP